MFTTPTTPQDMLNAFNDYFSAFPKNEAEIKKTLEKIKKIFETEYKSSTTMWKTYQKAASGDASPNEILTANKKLQDLMVSTRFAMFMTMPCSVFMLPALAKFAREHNIELIPNSVLAEFKI